MYRLGDDEVTNRLLVIEDLFASKFDGKGNREVVYTSLCHFSSLSLRNKGLGVETECLVSGVIDGGAVNAPRCGCCWRLLNQQHSVTDRFDRRGCITPSSAFPSTFSVASL
jgi:hypothetical protein